MQKTIEIYKALNTHSNTVLRLMWDYIFPGVAPPAKRSEVLIILTKLWSWRLENGN